MIEQDSTDREEGHISSVNRRGHEQGLIYIDKSIWNVDVYVFPKKRASTANWAAINNHEKGQLRKAQWSWYSLNVADNEKLIHRKCRVSQKFAWSWLAWLVLILTKGCKNKQAKSNNPCNRQLHRSKAQWKVVHVDIRKFLASETYIRFFCFLPLGSCETIFYIHIV